jgi:hypothetical protein
VCGSAQQERQEALPVWRVLQQLVPQRELLALQEIPLWQAFQQLAPQQELLALQLHPRQQHQRSCRQPPTPLDIHIST